MLNSGKHGQNKPSAGHLEAALKKDMRDREILQQEFGKIKTSGLKEHKDVIDHYRIENEFIKKRLMDAKIEQTKVKKQTNALLKGADAIPLSQALQHVDKLYSKHQETLDKVEVLRRDKQDDQTFLGKKEGLLKKIADFEASKGKSKSPIPSHNLKPLKKSEIITEERFNCIQVKDVFRNSKGEVITLQSPITQKVKKPSENRIGNMITLTETVEGQKAASKNNKENKSKTPAKQNLASLKTTNKDCKTNRLKDKDEKVVYANYSGNEVKLKREPSKDLIKTEKPVENKKLDQVNEVPKSEYKALTPIQLEVKPQSIDAEEDLLPTEVAGMINDEMDYLEEERLKLIREKIKESKADSYKYLEDFLVSKAKKLNYHNFNDPHYDDRPVSYKLSQEAEAKLMKNSKIKFENYKEKEDSKLDKSQRDNLIASKEISSEAIAISQPSNRGTQENEAIYRNNEASEMSLSNLVAVGMKQRAEERANMKDEEVAAYLAEVESDYLEKVERFKMIDEAERLEAEIIEKKKLEKFEQAKKEADAKEKKRLDQEKMLKIRSKAIEEEKELKMKMEQKLLEETMKLITRLQLPNLLEGSPTDDLDQTKNQNENIGNKEERSQLNHPAVVRPSEGHEEIEKQKISDNKFHEKIEPQREQTKGHITETVQNSLIELKKTSDEVVEPEIQNIKLEKEAESAKNLQNEANLHQVIDSNDRHKDKRVTESSDIAASIQGRVGGIHQAGHGIQSSLLANHSSTEHLQPTDNATHSEGDRPSKDGEDNASPDKFKMGQSALNNQALPVSDNDLSKTASLYQNEPETPSKQTFKDENPSIKDDGKEIFISNETKTKVEHLEPAIDTIANHTWEESSPIVNFQEIEESNKNKSGNQESDQLDKLGINSGQDIK